mmetsp:Transcript_15303/g.17010  ORF Transcript_15303/g.17010 Transcript_15303/m.17010 type:complete len:527 (+) Transcript_15303:68-1648(+)
MNPQFNLWFGNTFQFCKNAIERITGINTPQEVIEGEPDHKRVLIVLPLTTIEEVPYEILAAILAYESAPLRTLLSRRRVCKRWNYVVLNYTNELYILDKAWVPFISRFKQLNQLVFHLSNFNDRIIRHQLREIKHLRALNILFIVSKVDQMRRGRLRTAGEGFFQSLSNLRYLYIGDDQITLRQLMSIIKHCKYLKFLSLDICRGNQRLVASTLNFNFSRLRFLHLTVRENVSPAYFGEIVRGISQTTTLRYLGLDWTHPQKTQKAWVDTLIPIGDRLIEFHTDHLNVSQAFLNSLSRVTALPKLDFATQDFVVTHLTQLELLCCSSFALEGDKSNWLESHSRTLSNLNRLTITNSHIKTNELSQLIKFSSLTHLDLVTVNGSLEPLIGMNQLRRLVVASTETPQAISNVIGQMTQLFDLGLVYNGSVLIDSLTKLTQLAMLSLLPSLVEDATPFLNTLETMTWLSNLTIGKELIPSNLALLQKIDFLEVLAIISVADEQNDGVQPNTICAIREHLPLCKIIVKHA